MALGLGSATAGVALTERVLMNPMGLPGVGRLVRIFDAGTETEAAAYSRLAGFSAAAAYSTGGVGVEAGVSRGGVGLAAVTGGFFRTAGVTPMQGRDFTPDEQLAGDRVAVLGFELARAGFGRTPAIGRRVALGGVRFVVVGVMPPGFDFPSGTEVWVPVSAVRRDLLLVGGPAAGLVGYGELIGRLRSGVSLKAAAEQVAVRQRRQAAAYNRGHAGAPREGLSSLSIAPLAHSWTRGLSPIVVFLLAGVGTILLLSVLNASGVLLAGVLDRSRELFTRGALGAGRLRLARERLLEALALLLPATALGAGVAAILMAGIRRWAPVGVPGIERLRFGALDAGALLALGAATWLPLALPSTIAATGRRSRPGVNSRLWSALVAAQLGLALLLTVAAGLLLASFAHLAAMPLGFSTVGVESATFTPYPALAVLLSRGHTQAQLATAERRVSEIGERLLDAAAKQDDDVALASQPPLLSGPASLYVRPAGSAAAAGALAITNDIGGRYFRLLGIPLLRGRIFSSDTASSPPVAIVSRGLASAFWGSGDPLGRAVLVAGEHRARTVVGEVGDVRAGGPAAGGAIDGQIYFPYQQPIGGAPDLVATLLARGGGRTRLSDVVATIPGLELLAGPALSAATVQATAPEHIGALALAIFSGLALLLAWLGVFALLAHWVAGRRREIAVRLAFGAAPGSVAALVFGRAALVTAFGVGAAVLAGRAEAKLLAHLLFGVDPLSSAVWLASAGAVFATALAAAAAPALRAAHTDLAATLRRE